MASKKQRVAGHARVTFGGISPPCHIKNHRVIQDNDKEYRLFSELQETRKPNAKVLRTATVVKPTTSTVVNVSSRVPRQRKVLRLGDKLTEKGDHVESSHPSKIAINNHLDDDALNLLMESSTKLFNFPLKSPHSPPSRLTRRNLNADNVDDNRLEKNTTQSNPKVSTMPPINMSWEPIFELPVSINNTIVGLSSSLSKRSSPKERTHPKFNWVDVVEIPNKITTNSPNDNDFLQCDDELLRKNRQMKRKIAICNPEKIEETTINPFTWRKGRELIIKELGTFNRKSPMAITNNKKGKEEPNDIKSEKSFTNNLIEKLRDNDFETNRDDKKDEIIIDEILTKDVTEPPANNQMKKSTKRTSEKCRSTKAVVPESTSNTRQSTPKLRHYDRISVRRYIQEQRKERRKKADSDKVFLEMKKKERQEKLKELCERQQELIKSSKKLDVSEESPYIGLKRSVLPPSLTWIDLVNPKGVDKIRDNVSDDFAYKKLMSGQRPHKVSGWGFSLESSSGDERVSTTSRESTECSSLSNERVVGRGDTMKQPEVINSKLVSERLKILSEESSKAVDDLMSKITHQKTKGIERTNAFDVNGGRAAKLESLKQQALLLQSAIDQETQSLQRNLQVAMDSKANLASSFSIQEHQNHLPNVNINADTTLQNDIDDEINALCVSEGPLTESESELNFQVNNSKKASPVSERPGTDEIIQMILASTVFAKPTTDTCTTTVRKNDVGCGTDFEKQTVPSINRPTMIGDTDRVPSMASRENFLEEAYASDFETSIKETSTSVRSNYSSELPDFISINRSSLNQTPTNCSVSFSTFVDDHSARIGLNRELILDHKLSRITVENVTTDEENDEDVTSQSPLSSELSEIGAHSRVDSINRHTFEKSVRGSDLDNSNMTRSGINDQLNSPAENENDLQIPAPSHMMSPNALRLRMTAELTYLDTVNESLGQITDMERVRAVSVAQQEAVALAQLVQTRAKDGSNLETITPSMRLMQSHADAVKLSAEAAKLLAVTNGVLMASGSGNTNPGLQSQETVAAAAAAAVTAAMSQLKLNLGRHKERTASFLSNLSSEINRSPAAESEESFHSQDDWDSENSQQSVRLKPEYLNSGKVTKSEVEAEVEDDVEKKMTVSALSLSLPEELLSEAPLSPATSSDIRTEVSPSREGDQESFTEEDEKSSFRALLPSEGHLRSSRRRQNDPKQSRKQLRRATVSPSSDDQRSSVSSEATFEITEKDDENGGGVGDQLDDVPLFSGEESFRQFTMSMVKQYMQQEAMRSQHQKAVLKLREKALIDKANVELAWIELQKKRCHIKGQDDKVPPLSKKEQGLLLKLEKETTELRRQHKAGSHVEACGPEGDKNVTNEAEFDSANDSRLGINLDTSHTKSSDVLHGLKKLQASKRYLTRREQKLYLRRKHIEELLNWQHLLDSEEAKVREMEHMALTMLVPNDKSQSNPYNSSVVVATVHEDGNYKNRDDLLLPIVTVNSVGKDPSDDAKSTHGDHSEPSGENKSSSQIANKTTCVLKSNVASTVIRSPSVVLRSPLTPQRSKTRIRRESSGSEDSCTVSQSETTSELSDIEGRVHALKEDLRRRRIEAERLRREQKRKNKERLRAQEASLIRQIDVYDKFIARTRLDLEKELEKHQADGTISPKVPSVRPVIKQPKVAESKRIQRQAGIDGNSGICSPEVRAEDSLSRTVSRESEVSASPQTSFESGEETNVADSTARKSVVSKGTHTDESEKISDQPLADSDDLVPSLCHNEPDQKIIEPNRELEEKSDQVSHSSIHEGTLSFNSEMTEDIVIGLVETTANESSSSVELNFASPQQEVSPKAFHGDYVDTNDENFNKKNENVLEKRARLVDNIVDTILGRMIRDELTLKTVENKTNIADKSSEPTLKADRPPLSVAKHIADNLMENLLEEVIVDCIKIRRELMLVDQDLPKSSLIEKKSKSVSERISEIMSDVVDQRCVTLHDNGDRNCTRTQRTPTAHQDLLILSFPSPPPVEDAGPLLLTSPSTDCDKLVSPIVTEERPTVENTSNPNDPNQSDFATELASSLEALENLNNDDNVGEPEWFEDEYGVDPTTCPIIESSHHSTTQEEDSKEKQQEQMVQHYQIYPYQDYFYIREIPNKPPPPYTPPSEPQNRQSTTSIVSNVTNISNNNCIAPPFNGTAISSADFKRLSVDMLSAVDYSSEQTIKLLDGALQCVLLDRIVDGYFTVADKEEDINNRSRRVYKQFILQLVRETVTSIREEERRPPRKPWSKPEWPSKEGRRRRPYIGDSEEDLKIEVQRRLFPLLLSDDDESSPLQIVISQQPNRRKKRDVVDEILLCELRKEESEWVDYDEDETTVKMQLADSILDDLIDDTMRFLMQVQ